MITVQVLGQVSIHAGGLRTIANGSKMWTVATMLALHPNTFVSIDRLVQEVWESNPPASAVANIRTYTSNLRRVLGPAAGRVSGRRTAYRLDLEPTELDLSQFEQLVGAGRTALGRRDAVRSAASLKSALALFSGPVLLGVRPGEALTEATSNLEEQRMGAVEELYSAELALGHHIELVSALRQHVRAHPLRERGWGQLMVALYRSGDPAAALSTFGQARTTLIKDLGIEPGPQLRSLQQAVLRRSPELDLPQRITATAGSTAPITVPTPTPHELPRATPWFTGRAAELSRLRQAFDAARDAPVVIAVHGPAGTGTSTLAIQASHEHADRYPDGHLYIDMRHEQRPICATDAATQLLLALGLDPDAPIRTPGVFADLRSRLAGRRVLIVVDNVTGPDQVTPLIPAAPGNALVVTSHRVLSTLDACHLGIGPLTSADSLDLLRAVIGEQRMGAEPLAAAALVGYCDHLPLAIRVAGARLVERTEWSIADLARRLADKRARLTELSVDGLSVRACLATNYATLTSATDETSRSAQRLFLILGSRDGTSVSAMDVADWLKTSTRDAEAALLALADLRLLGVTSSGRYELAPLTHIFATELATGTPPVLTAEGRPVN